MKLLGVIGGLGPLATAQFFEMVVRMTDARFDHEHIPMIIYNQPATPDRTRFILGLSPDSPLPAMLAAGKALAAQGAGLIAIPCVTAYFFYRELSAGIQAPIIDMISETAACLQRNGVNRAGLMATDGTITAGFFRHGLENCGIRVAEPSPEAQARTMKIIYNSVKANQPVDMADFRLVEEDLRSQGAEVIILGCTELSSIRLDADIGHGYLDAMQVQAGRAVELCGGRLKPEFSQLIT